jgi:hypothetical protein
MKMFIVKKYIYFQFVLPLTNDYGVEIIFHGMINGCGSFNCLYSCYEVGCGYETPL